MALIDTIMSSAELVPEEKAVPEEDLVCFHCNKKPESDGAEMLRCSRCCGPSYCGEFELADCTITLRILIIVMII